MFTGDHVELKTPRAPRSELGSRARGVVNTGSAGDEVTAVYRLPGFN